MLDTDNDTHTRDFNFAFWKAQVQSVLSKGEVGEQVGQIGIFIVQSRIKNKVWILRKVPPAPIVLN